MRRAFLFSAFALAATLFLSFGTGSAQGQTTAKPTEIELVQTPGQFEPKELKLKAGTYVFKIVNKGIDHNVGFYLQHDNDKGKKVAKSDTGLIKTNTSAKTGVVVLKPGKYVYSCPLNPTPHYVITVE